MKSILFPFAEATIVKKIPVKAIINEWDKSYGIDVNRFFEGLQSIDEYKCNHCGIYFYTPSSMAGDEAFYKGLMNIPWYYLNEKWEYNKALSYLSPNMNILEIGAGKGAFLKKCLAADINVLGLEFNSEAVDYAKKDGIPMLNEKIDKQSVGNFEFYDAILSFQVLEHIPDPLPFIESCLKCLKSDGLLIFSVPNSDNQLIRAHNIFDAPPHHMLGWTYSSFISLQQLFPLQLIKIEYEPLSEIHIDWYLNLVQKRSFFYRQFLRWKLFKAITRKILKLGGRKLIKGHSHMVIFKKIK